jgi:hypothetical protein
LARLPRVLLSVESATLGSRPERRTTWRARWKRRASPISASRWQARSGPTPKDRLQGQAAPVAGGEAGELALERALLALERVDQAQQQLEVGAAGGWERERGRPAAALPGQQPRALAGPALTG